VAPLQRADLGGHRGLGEAEPAGGDSAVLAFARRVAVSRAAQVSQLLRLVARLQA